MDHFVRLLSDGASGKGLFSSLPCKTLIARPSVLNVGSRSRLEAVSACVDQGNAQLVAHSIGEVAGLFVVKRQDAYLRTVRRTCSRNEVPIEVKSQYKLTWILPTKCSTLNLGFWRIICKATTSALGLSTCSRLNRNWRFKLVTSIVSRSTCSENLIYK